MLKEKTLSFAIICLSVSIVISSLIIYKGMDRYGNYVSTGMYNMSNNLTQSMYDLSRYVFEDNDNIMDIHSTARYLGLDVNDLIKVIHTEGVEFPYVKVGGRFIINRIALDKWLETARIEIK